MDYNPYEIWKGKHVCFLGDSITDAVTVNVGERYFELLAEKVGFIPHGYGVNGAQYHNLLSQAERMREELGDTVDAIFLFAGTNDYNAAKPLGEWYTLTPEYVTVHRNAKTGEPSLQDNRLRRDFIFDDNTFKGSINKVLSFLKTHYADKTIVLMSPLHRAYADFGCENIQYNELYPNARGLYLDDYLKVVREAANVWATEFIDMNAVSGLFPLYDKSASLYFANDKLDRLHPGKRGHSRMAEVLFRKLPTIALF